MIQGQKLKDLFEKYEIEDSGCANSCPDAWIPTIDILIEKLIQNGWEKKLYQIKEKFGGLRFYTETSGPEQVHLIRWAEGTCSDMCIECGSKEDLSEGPWGKILCKEHIPKDDGRL